MAMSRERLELASEWACELDRVKGYRIELPELIRNLIAEVERLQLIESRMTHTNKRESDRDKAKAT